MVMDVDLLGTTVEASPNQGEDWESERVSSGDDNNLSFSSWQERDTSCSTRRDMSDTRQCLSSILNCTSEDEEDDDEVGPILPRTLFENDEQLNFAPIDQSLIEPAEEDNGVENERDTETSGFCCEPEEPTSTSSAMACSAPAFHPDDEDESPSSSSWLDQSLAHVTDSFITTLCPQDDSCGSLDNVCQLTANYTSSLQRQVHLDLLSVLGCPVDPSDDELDAWVAPMFFWTPNALANTIPTPKKPPRPFHRSIKKRADKIHNWRVTMYQQQQHQQESPSSKNKRRVSLSKSMDDSCVESRKRQSTASTTGKASTQLLLTKSLLYDNDDPLGLFIGKGLEPIEPAQDEDVVDLGYDSDPENYVGGMVTNSDAHHHNRRATWTTSTENGTRTVTPTQDDEEEDHYDASYMPFDAHRSRVAEQTKDAMAIMENNPLGIQPSVQESLNTTWTLTWHPANAKQPVLSHVWIERGSLLNCGNTVVEPKFMWRHVYQPDLHSCRKLHATSQKPLEVRVLNACRIVEAKSIDRTKYPMARTSNSFYLRTCRDEEFLFEASNPHERAVVVQAWKCVVARLASLAVLEEMETMALEFFTPVVTSQMLLGNIYQRSATY